MRGEARRVIRVFEATFTFFTAIQLEVDTEPTGQAKVVGGPLFLVVACRDYREKYIAKTAGKSYHLKKLDGT